MKKIVFSSLFFVSLLFGQSYVLDFDGSNDYLSVSAANNASTKLDGQFTVSAWVFIEGENKQQIFYNDGGELEWLGTAYNFFRVQPGAVRSVTNLHRYQWHHVVMTRNSSNSIQIYVNGNLSQYYVSNSGARDDILYIGRDPNQGEYFDGSMDEIAIWSTELSAAQINTLYNKGIPESATNISGASSSLQSYWKLEQSTGNTAANSVTNGTALTLNNGPTWGKFKHSAIPEMMYNIRTGSNSSYPEKFIEYNGKIYFKADDGSKGSEMWVFDPANDASSSNPQRISDIRSGSGSGISYTDHWLVWNNKLYFVGNDGSYGDELYSYDGSSFTRITDINSGSNSSGPNYFTVYNDKLYFSANNSTYGTELYVYDGTNVSLVADNASGSTSGFGWGGMKVYKEKLYFQGYSTTVGYELYAYDGTSISLVKDISSGTSGKIQDDINNSNIDINTRAARAATGETNRPASDMHHHRSNASLSNSINPVMKTSGSSAYVNSSYPNQFTLYNDKLFFTATDTTIGNELFYYDGTNITGIDLYPGSSTNGSYTSLNSGHPYGITVYKDALYFEGNGSTAEWELYSYDPTNGYRLIKDIALGTYTSGSNTYQNQGHPHGLTIFDNKLYFSGEDGYNVKGSAGGELWYYGGNNAGRVMDIYSGPSGSYPYSFYATTDKMYFRAQASSTGSEPYILTSLDPFPSIASVTSTTADGGYKTGDEINITVNFSEAVTLSSGGSMTVTLETGSTDRTLSITSISNVASVAGSYTVQAGDVSSDLNVKSITVSGTLYDNSEQVMEDYSVGSNLSSSKAIVVDGLNPAVASIKSASTNTTYGTGAEINITVNFSEAVTLSSGGSMTVTLETGSTDRTVSITSISNTNSASGTYTVRDGDGSSDLSVNSIALSSGATLKDAVGNTMSDFSVPADSNLSDFNAIVINTTKPSTPLGFVVSSNYGSVGLSWIEISGATYKVYRSASTSDFASVGAPSTNSYADTPSEVKRYYYYVTSVNSLGESSPSDTLHGYPSKIWYVEMGGSDSNDGKSKAAAFKTIEQAVKTNNSLVSGDTLYVGPSISSSKTRDQSGGYYDFGGISGGINLGHSKDFVLIGTSGADSTIFNAEGKNRHFTFYDGQTAATQIIDITFYNGEDNSWPGGGSISIRNSATKLQFVNCVFDSNRVTKDFGGGAIEIRDQALPSFTGCTFKNNYVLKSESGSQGGAVFISSPNSEDDLNNAINFKQCTFIGNYSKGKQSTYGGAVYAYKNTVFENCLFVKNGAIAGWGQSSSTWENARGGAIWSAGGSGNTGITTAVANCTFDSNYVEVLTSEGSPAGSDIFYGYNSNNQTMRAYVFNTVITGSYHLLGGAPAYTNSNEKQYRIFYTEHTDNRLFVDYSAIEGSADQSWADDHVFDIIPVYTDRSNGDYSINNLSPVIGQGTSSFESISAPSIDILGASRPSSNPDMGAYENSLASSDAPLPVSGIVGTAKTNSVYLTWSSTKSSLSSTSDAANIQYLIYQGGSQVGTSLSTSFTVASLTNGATYSFKVAAQDTITTITGAPSGAISITPTYTGPYWYVASSGGSSSNTENADLGSREVPLNHMASAIESAAAGDTIVMMKGTHTGSSNRGINWNAGKSLVIMGDPDYVADSTIINAGGRDRHFTFDSGEDSTYQVIGLTLYNGKTTDNDGGGSVSMRNNSSPVFRKVIFKQNVNLADNWDGGGAVSARNFSRPSFYYCIFDGNTVQRTGENQNEANGGAVWISGSSNSASQFVLFDGCTFKNNVARGKGGARGGAIRAYESQVLITNSLFYGNMTFANEDGTNTHGSNGGAIHITGPSYYSSDQQQWIGSDVKIINSTIVNNLTKTGNSSTTGLSGSGIYLDSWGRSEKAWFFNNIVWGNRTSSDGSLEQVYFSNESGWGGKYLNYNVVQSSENIASMQDDDSFETDPTFSDSTNGDYSLANSSILIGKGGASYEGMSAPNTDLLGLSRPNPYGSSPDIGAYENSLAITPYPAPVKNLTAVGGSGSITLTWDTAADADSVYKVYKRDGAAFSVAAEHYYDKTTDTTFTITGLDNDTRYYLRVAAVNKEGYEGTSAAIDITPTYSGPVWWVSTTGLDSNEGSSGSPFKSIEHAIDHVTAGDTVMLKKGTYTGSGNRGIEISINDQETNFDNYKNVVMTSEKGPDSTIIDANYEGNHFVLRGDNKRGLDSTFQFIGLTFTNGRAKYPGGSFVIQGGDGSTSNSRPKMQPKFENCIFKNNEAKSNGNDYVSGGAFSIIAATPIFENCLFENNRAWGAGGAIDIQQMWSITDTTWIRNTVFRNNISHNEGNKEVSAVEGGAIHVSQGINLIISSSNFFNNQAIRYSDDNWQGVRGGAIKIGRSWDFEKNPLIRIYNSRFSKNESVNYAATQANAGAIYSGAPIWIANSVIDSNSTISANSASGGAFEFNIEQNQNVGTGYLINNTIVHNGAFSSNGNGQSGGGAIAIYKTKGIWFNNIFWGNDSDQEPGRKAFVIQDMNDISQNYNNVKYKDETEALSGFQFGDNTYSFEPGFYSATNYQLSTGSPLIGAGTSSYEGHNAPGKDILGNDRPNPSGSSPDLGAYENALAESPYPKQVQNLVVQGGSREVTLSWDANTETDIVKYLIYKSETQGFMPASSDSVDETKSTSYTVTGLDNRIEYNFTVAAVNSSGYRGTFANQVSATPQYNGPNWYVAVDGSNANDGNADSPLKDLKTAIDSAKTGHTVILLAGYHSGPDNREIMLSDGRAIRIIGDPNSNVEDVVLDAENSGRHFNIFGDYDSTMVFKNITFRGGNGQGDGGDWRLAGSIRIEGGSYWDEQNQQQVEGYPSPKFIGCVWEDNHVGSDSDWGAGGAIAIRDASPIFVSCTFKNNSASMRGGAFYSQTMNSQEASSPEFRYTIFSNNSANSQNDDTRGGAVNLEGAGEVDFIDCLFEYNMARSQNSNASGGAVGLEFWQPNFGSNVLFDRCVFVNNVVESNSSGSGAEGGAISSSTPFEMVNSVVIKNRVKGNWGVGGGIAISIPDQDGTQGHSLLINNTIAHNEVLDNNGNPAFSGGGIAAINTPSQGGLWFNNIVYGNKSSNDHSIHVDGGANIDMAYLAVDDGAGKTWFDASTMVTENPKFKNPTSGDYRLSSTSALIDAGASNYGGENAPQIDSRNYYRLGLPDIGALETGASKYLLTMADDITDDKDTTFVDLTQEVKFTITTGDLDGNIVTDSNEPVKWDIFPNQKYARVDIDADTSTSGGSASATVIVTSEEKGKGFRFRVIADVGGASLRSEMYVIEALELGAPPPVTDLTITPSDWTNQPNFTLSWETPAWAAQRELIGAVVEITDGISVYNQYLDFQGDTLTNFAFIAPEAGQFDASLRLIDELGNEDKDSSRSVTAYFDDVAPEAFQIHYPESLEEIIYTSDKPRFYWEESGDYPSGIKEWRLFINNNLYGTYMVNDVTYDNGDVYIDAENALADGYYDWYLEASDHAENITMSTDTGHFGVDLSPPNINHSSPLILVDENSTSPSINVSFSDAASGVNFGRLHYRRAGLSGGFTTLDLLAGPVSIPGSDIKKDGLEYYIDSEDNIGNYSYWPQDKAFQSVKVRSEATISTASQWASGVPGSGTDSTNYWFFSIPFDIGNAKNVITSVMGQPDEFNYRLYGYNNGWQENPASVTLGNGYFFIYDPAKYEDILPIQFDFGTGVSTSTDPPFKINVSPGNWKFIGTPYNFNVPLSNVYTEDGSSLNDAGSIYTWNGSWSSAGSNMQPWKGYIFKSGGATELHIDGRGSGFGKMAKSVANGDDIPMNGDEWIVDIIATTGEGRDEMNAVGVRHMAKDGYDRFDEFEPPVVPGNLSLRVDNRHRELSPDLYAKDIRKPNKEGHYWDLQVFAPTNGLRTYLTFEGLGYIPQEYDVFLINKTTKQAKNLEWESSYRFANTGSDNYLKQDFRLVVGTKKFVEDNNAGVNLYPDAFTLAQNYPNPFNPQTSIMISLEEDAQVDLIIYNLLGEEITRLAANERRPAGYYNFIWNGRNEMGTKVSTGVYFYHALIRNEQGKVVLNKTRKMIFLK